jgi:glutamate-1-semialdehyde 2,1-aminomutase
MQNGGGMEKSLQERASRVAPTCIRLVSALMPANTPRFFARAHGARLWDADGREYIDFMGAMGPNLLGYGDPRVEAAADHQRQLGDTMTGPAPVMVELAEKLVETISHADWALFVKNGSDATSVALRIARAQTGKRRVLVATGSYHGSYPWCTPVMSGILPEERAHRTEYAYNDIASLDAAVADAGDDLAAIFATGYMHDMFRENSLPKVEYARRCREACDQSGALLVIDDIRAGFRLSRDCTWTLAGVQPDLSCWGKAIANGYPISAVLGSDRARDGVLNVPLSGTFWWQAVPMAAALATIEIISTTNYLEHMVDLGQTLRTGLGERAAAHGFALNQTGPVQMPIIMFKNDPEFRLSVAFVGAMMQRGVYLHPFHNVFVCAAMTKADIALTIAAADDAFAEMEKRDGRFDPPPAALLSVLGRSLHSSPNA